MTSRIQFPVSVKQLLQYKLSLVSVHFIALCSRLRTRDWMLRFSTRYPIGDVSVVNGFRPLTDKPTSLHHITSHHIEKTEAGLKGLYIREITTVIGLLICYY